MTEEKRMEYSSLRDEIQKKIDLHNKLITFTITTAVAIIAFVYNQKNPYMLLMPLFVILPLSSRVAYYRNSISKMAAYLIVFYEEDIEDLCWETRNFNIVTSNRNTTISKLANFVIMHYYDCIAITIACCSLFIYRFFAQKAENMSVFTIVKGLIIPLMAIVYELYITIRINKSDTAKLKWIKTWENEKKKERITVENSTE